MKTIAEEGNIVNSSAKLFLTQSALSHQLRELEGRLGFKVFHRTRYKWELTEEGIALYTLADNVLSVIEKGFEAIEEIKTGSKGTIKISTECYSFYHNIPGFIQKMGVLYPQIDVELILEATHQPITKLISYDIDIALVTSAPVNNLLFSKKLFEDEIFAVMHKEHVLSQEAYLEPNHFANIHLIIHSFPLESVSVYEHFLKPNQITPQKISAIPLTEVSLEMINANMGVMCMPKWALQSLKISKDIVLKKIGKQGLKRTHYLVIREQDKDKKYISDFVLNFEEGFSVF
ncbi:LysR family transcriptional regulator [Aquimarina sp. I32.4]|uniref:LysR family transcriptional regulator n=1 Tax=Aquimarina sp. I32.4 TaxID=2053903 RepID=UPI000CDEBA8A|nr:LysR family transcriptional regulator [Aquimarina sp. I32.4]